MSPTAPAVAGPEEGAAPENAAGHGARLEAGPPVSLYVHVPFCLSVCPWCDFVVYGGAAARGPRSRMPAFLEALHVELDLRADALDARWPVRLPLETVYLGGGTPSLLPASAVAAILEHVRRRFGIEAGAEVTLEANPGPDDRGDIAGLVEAGVNRLSVGVQSLDPGQLRALGRRHRPADAAESVAAARAAGVGSVSLDLLYDIPGGSLATWDRTLDGALALAPDHLSIYALTLDDPEADGLTGPLGDHLAPSAGARRWRVRAGLGQDEDRAAAQYRLAVDRLMADGWRGYEISNWARPGHESRHNQVYWGRRPYEAVGPGAHAFDGLRRRWSAARLDAYLAALLSGAGPALPPGGGESLDATTAAAEAVILGLRMDRGVPVDVAARSQFAPHLQWALGAGLAELTTAGRIVLTTSGRLLSNELFARLV